MEKTWFYFFYHSSEDRGFLSLPLCPIYGGSLFLIRLLLGFPVKEGERYPYDLLRILGYAVFASLIATAAELLTGLYFDRVLHMRLWSYLGEPHEWGGYICLPMSVGWGFLIAVGMGFVWKPLEERLSRLPIAVLFTSDLLLTIAVLTDFLLSLAAA